MGEEPASEDTLSIVGGGDSDEQGVVSPPSPAVDEGGGGEGWEDEEGVGEVCRMTERCQMAPVQVFYDPK